MGSTVVITPEIEDGPPAIVFDGQPECFSELRTNGVGGFSHFVFIFVFQGRFPAGV